jgi:hypothetical protein
MAMNFNELEIALYHIRVNYFGGSSDNLSIQLSAYANGDTIIDVWNEYFKRVGNFMLSEVVEEIALLQAGKIDFCDLSANNAEDENF